LKRKLTDRALPERLPTWGILLLESHHSPEFTMDWRTHPFVKVVYVLSGKGTFHLGNQSEPFSTGDVIVVAPGTRNRIEDDPSSASSLYVCCIAKSLLRFDSDLVQRLATHVFRGDGHFANRVASILRRMVHAQEVETPTRSVALVADAMKLIHAVCQRGEKSRRSEKDVANERATVERYVENLPSQFFDESTIDAAANQLGIPRRTFTKLFTEITGETWLNHIRRLAIEHAQRRLQQTDLPITSVAFECGFNDLSTFYRQFKTHCGMSPGKYRANSESDQLPMR
jgi:AraC family L-rhamnose operon regulatory protein RhaS